MLESLMFWRKKKEPEYQRYGIRDSISSVSSVTQKIRGLKKRSSNWNDDDLKEIVEVLYILNNKLVELSDSLNVIQSDGRATALYGSQQRAQSFDTVQKTTFRSGHQHTHKDKSPSSQDAGPLNPAAEEFEKMIERCDKYMHIFEEAQKLIGDKKPIFDDYRNLMVTPYKKISKQSSDLNPVERRNPTTYVKFTHELRKIPVSSLSLSLCFSLEHEMSKQEFSDKRQLVGKKIKEIAEFMNWQIINPDKGDPFNEAEHEIMEYVSNDRVGSGLIFKVNNRGYKHRKSGKIHEKAKVCITT